MCYPNYFLILSDAFQGVFRLTTKDNVEYLLQAANSDEREEWTTEIANAIRKLDIKDKVIQCQKPKPNDFLSLDNNTQAIK